MLLRVPARERVKGWREILEKPTVWQDIQRIRAEAPLVHNITNYVVMNTTANALLAVGASPVMAHAQEEVEEMASLAKALVINIGTLSAAWIDSMMKAGRAARQKGIPIVLDPVGSGATRFRTETAQALAARLRLRRSFAATLRKSGPWSSQNKAPRASKACMRRRRLSKRRRSCRQISAASCRSAVGQI